jgi:hypothetical protein
MDVYEGVEVEIPSYSIPEVTLSDPMEVSSFELFK